MLCLPTRLLRPSLLLLITAACVPEGRPISALKTDGSTSADSGVVAPADSGAIPDDSGVIPDDAGFAADAMEVDAAPGQDATPMADTGVRRDGGPRMDAGPGMDAAANPDATPAVDSGPVDAGPFTTNFDVLQYHKNPEHNGVFVDPAFTRAAAANLRQDNAFTATYSGNAYAQSLYVANGPGGTAAFIIATEANDVVALNAATGAALWTQNLGNPVALGNLPCGNINPLGITGTPVIDLPARKIYVDAMTTPDGGTTKRHLIAQLDLDTGAPTMGGGWPVDVDQAFMMMAFDSSLHNQRASLLLLNGVVYVGFSGHDGDCGNYFGWVIGVPVANPGAAAAWRTRGRGGGIWGGGAGPAGDSVGNFVYAVTGNTFVGATYSDGEGVIRFAAGAGSFSGTMVDFYAPTNWKQLDNTDLDLGGAGAVVFDLPGSTPSALVAALGKDGNVYLMDRTNLAGIAAAVTTYGAASGEIKAGSTVYTTPSGTYLAFGGVNGAHCPAGGGNLVALKITPGAPPTITTAWCANQGGGGTPITTMIDPAGNDAIVWSVGASGDNHLHGFNADTGAEIFAGANVSLSGFRYFSNVIAVDGRILAARNGSATAFTVR